MRARSLATVAVAAATLGALMLGTARPAPAQPAPAQPAAAQPAPAVSLVSQSAFVGPGGTWTLRLRLDPSVVGAATRVVVTPFRAVGSRSEFVLTLGDRIVARPVAGSVAVPTESADENRLLSVALDLQDPTQPRDPARLDLGTRDGVFPVRVVVQRGDGSLVDRFVTHLVYLAEERVGAKLGVALVVPVEAEAEPDDPAATEARLAALVSTLARHPDAAYTLAPRPHTLTRLDGATLASLAQVAAGRQVLGETYVDVEPSVLVGLGLETELDRQVQAGTETLTELLGTTPDTTTMVGRAGAGDPGLDQRGLVSMHQRGVQRVVVAEADLMAIDQRLSTSRPFLLPISPDDSADLGTIPAALGDAGLSAHFDNTRNPALAAHQLLADLAVLYMDEPGTDRRTVVVMPGRDSEVSPRLLDPFLEVLADHPVLEPVLVSSVFESNPLDLTRSGDPLTRRLVAPAPEGALVDELAAVADDLRRGRDELASLGAVVGEDALTIALGDETSRPLLVAQARGLEPAQRREHLERVSDAVRSHLDLIRMPSSQSITITAREAEIPLTLQNSTGGTVRVVLRMASDKLDFPLGRSREVELTRLNTTERVPVVARTSGAFPLDVTLESPDGRLVIGQARITVNSTATSELGLVISAGAAGFLALWWGRQLFRERRRGRFGRSRDQAGKTPRGSPGESEAVYT